jgi:hypothetical protein
MLVEPINSIATLRGMSKKKQPLLPWQVEDAARLDALFQKRKEKTSQEKFGADYDIGSQGMVWQYLKGHRPLNIKAAEAFARGLGVKIEDFSPTLAEQIKKAAATTSSQNGTRRDEQSLSFLDLNSLESQLVMLYRGLSGPGKDHLLSLANQMFNERDPDKASAANPFAGPRRRKGEPDYAGKDNEAEKNK